MINKVLDGIVELKHSQLSLGLRQINTKQLSSKSAEYLGYMVYFEGLKIIFCVICFPIQVLTKLLCEFMSDCLLSVIREYTWIFLQCFVIPTNPTDSILLSNRNLFKTQGAKIADFKKITNDRMEYEKQFSEWNFSHEKSI